MKQALRYILDDITYLLRWYRDAYADYRYWINREIYPRTEQECNPKYWGLSEKDNPHP